jgi:hypothetical protein
VERLLLVQLQQQLHDEDVECTYPMKFFSNTFFYIIFRLDRRGKRDLKSNIYFLCQPIFGLTCFSTACRAAAVTKLQQTIQQKGDIANAPLSVLINGTTQQFPLLLKFIGFLTTGE